MPALGQGSHLPDQPPGGAAPLSLPSNSSTTSNSSHQQAAEAAEDISGGGGRGGLQVPLSGHRCQPEQATLLAMPNSADNSSKQEHHQLGAGGSATMKRPQPAGSPAACSPLAAKALQQQQQPTATDDDTLMDQQQHERGSADDDDTGMGDDDGYDSELGAGSDEVLGDEDDEEGSRDELGSDDDGMGLQSHRKLGHGFMSSTDVAEYDGSEYDSDKGEDMGAARHEYCRNCTNVMYNGWCPACLHERVNDVLLVGDGTPFSATPDLAPEARAGLDGVVAATATAAVLTSSRGVAAAAAAAGVVVQPRAAGLVPPVALLFDQRMEAHEEGKASPHPERPDRTRAIVTALTRAGLTDHCVRVECPEATYEQLAAVHTPDLIDFVKAMAEGLPPPPSYPASLLTQDTYINAHTYTCARLAAGGAAAVATQVASGQAGHGAAIVRPPGHHAESNMAMGFCFFNNAAVAARAAQAAGAQRVLILDWDIHHGNGTQHIFQEDNSVLYMSLHRHDRGQFYPGTGAASEVGDGPGEGYTVNVAWDGPEVQNGDYLAAFQHVVCPIAYEFNPSLIIVSAGFDAADGDPIGGCRVTPQAFAHMTAMLKGIAPLVLLLEGGYNLDATAKSTEACLRVLLGEQPPVLPGLRQPTPIGVQGILNTMAAHARYWGSMRAMAAALKAAQPAPVPPPAPPPQPPRVPSIAAPTPAGMPPILAAAARHSQRAVAVRAGEAARAARRERRKRQLFQKVRNQAMACWWARHRHIVAARQQAAALAAEAVLADAGEL